MLIRTFEVYVIINLTLDYLVNVIVCKHMHFYLFWA